MFLMCHAFAYFSFDTIMEIYYGSADFFMNFHHVVVLTCNYLHLRSYSGGFEYCGKIFNDKLLVLHFIAESSNPFLAARGAMISANKQHLWIYGVNEKIFAVTFLMARMIGAPLLILYMWEGDKILFSTKIGLNFILYVSCLWGFTILYNIAIVVKESFETKETKDKGNVPKVVLLFHDTLKAIETEKEA